MAKRLPTRPAHPERICWGCEKYCPADDMRCGNGKERTQHPSETFGADWASFVLPSEADATDAFCGARTAAARAEAGG